MIKKWKKLCCGALAAVFLCASVLGGQTYAAEPSAAEEVYEEQEAEDFITEEDSVEPEAAAVTDYYADRRHVIGTMTVYDDNGNFVDSFRQSWLQVNGETAYCMHVDKHFVNGYMYRSNALEGDYPFSQTGLTRFALWEKYIREYPGMEEDKKYLVFQAMLWRELGYQNEWNSNHIYQDADRVPHAKQLQMMAEAKAYAEENLNNYVGKGWVYTYGNNQPVAQFWVEEAPKGKVQLKKTSANTSITGGNGCYSLAGAVYGVYTDAACSNKVAQLTTEAGGNSAAVEVKPGNYYVKEITAPQGFLKDERVYRASVTSGQTAVVSVSDIPGNDPAAVEITKVDAEGNAVQGGASLAGAQFTVKYYDGYYTKDTLPATATKTWVLETKPLTNNGTTYYYCRLSNAYKVSGDEFYYVTGNPDPILPLGTISVEETKAPTGYTLDGSYLRADGSTTKITGAYVSRITKNGEAIYLNGGNKFTVSDYVKRGDFSFNKVEAGTLRPMADVLFSVTSKTTGESHNIVTDANGFYSTAADDIWFGAGTPDASKGALPYDTYVVKELPCEANRGHKLISFEVTVTEEVNISLGSVENEPIGIGTTAAIQGTEDKEAFAVGEVSIEDKVTYTNLDPGREYVLKGVLMDKGTGEPLLIDGSEVTAEKTFTPAQENGTVSVIFTFDASALRGREVVVFETLYRNGDLVTAHTDIHDIGQTIKFKEPTVKTKAAEASTGTQEGYAAGNVTITDRVTYTGLIIGKEYTVKGTLMEKETKQEFLVDGKTVTASRTFTAARENGTIDLSFTFDASALRGREIVVFERVYYDGKKIAVHADINDADQTIQFKEPEISTTAFDKSTDTNEGYAVGRVTVIDCVSYKGLLPGREYVLNGILMDKGTGEPLLLDGETVTAAKTFTAEAEAGSVRMAFTFDASVLRGKEIVVFEKLFYQDKEIAIHEDLSDAGQTIKFKEPEIKTTVVDASTGTKESYAVEEITLIDKVSYKGLIAGKKYAVCGFMMDKATGEILLDEGNPVFGETFFTADAAEGIVEVSFTFHASALQGKEIVAFEKLFYDGREIACHEDLQDKDQTITFKNPSVKTTAKDKATGTQETPAEKQVTIMDTVTYTGLIVGKEYTVKGTVMDKVTGRPFLNGGKPVTAEKVFTAQNADGSIEISFTFDASVLVNKEIVVFEKLFYDGREIVCHEDLNDKDQTITFKELPPPPKTGDTADYWLYCVVALAALFFATIAWKKSRKPER